MTDTTLCFLLRQCKGDAKQILLGLKKLGLGMGKLNGFGGKVKAGESIEEAAVRELYEETGVMATPRDITKVGEMAFFFPAVPEEEGWNQRMHIFFANEWEGEPSKAKPSAVKIFLPTSHAHYSTPLLRSSLPLSGTLPLEPRLA